MYFENLDVWKRSVTLCSEVYKAMAQQRDYGFKDQFLSYAKASCAELRTQIHIGININYIDKVQGQQWLEEARQLSKMIYALMRKISAPRPAISTKKDLKSEI